MRIGVISDTHIPVFLSGIPTDVKNVFATCDMIVHAGDIVEEGVIDELRKIAETKAVHGNMDSDSLKRNLPASIVFDAGGKKIGLTHGKGTGKGVLEWVRAQFRGDLDIIIFGHSHTPLNEKIGNTLFFNPGSATDTVFSGKRTYGIITIDGEEARGEIFEISG
jgi:uncharacterized protein